MNVRTPLAISLGILTVFLFLQIKIMSDTIDIKNINNLRSTTTPTTTRSSLPAPKIYYLDLSKTSLDTNISTKTSTQISKSSESKKEPLVMYALIFGTKSWESPVLQLYLRSVEFSGFDVLLIGHGITEQVAHSFPSNVRHIRISWDMMIDRMVQRFVEHKRNNNNDFNLIQKVLKLKQASFYKATDFKPLVPFLYPEYFRKYKYWGWTDVDMVYSNLFTQFLMASKYKFDVVNAMGCKHDQMANGWLGIFNRIWYDEYVVPLLLGKYYYVLKYVMTTVKHTNFGETGEYHSAAKGFEVSTTCSSVLVYII